MLLLLLLLLLLGVVVVLLCRPHTHPLTRGAPIRPRHPPPHP
jgi:hypothetical protein